MAAELAEAARHHEPWSLHAEALRGAPHLPVRNLGVHIADELEPADVLTERSSGTGSDLYPRLPAAAGATAVRVAAGLPGPRA